MSAWNFIIYLFIVYYYIIQRYISNIFKSLTDCHQEDYKSINATWRTIQFSNTLVHCSKVLFILNSLLLTLILLLTCICLMAGGLLVKRDVRPSHDVTSDRHTTWRQTVTRRKRFVKWLPNAIKHNAQPAARISQFDNSHPVPIRCFWILLEFRNTIVRVRSRVIRDIFGR